jgi:hypothetical protein
MVEDSSGRLLVGTSSTSATLTTILQGNSSSATSNAGLMLARGEAPAADGTVLGALDYAANNHVIASRILCKRDGGTWTAGTSQPTRLEFSTTADGAASPTERFRISNDGSFSSVIPGGSTLYPQFGCRAWVNFNGTGTVAIRASGNVSSITDHAVGQYSINFTTAMPDANYCFQGNGNTAKVYNEDDVTVVRTTSALRINVRESSTQAFVDTSQISVAIFR